MSIRLNCTSCRTAFLTAEDNLGRTVPCPKCGSAQQVPSTVAAPSERVQRPQAQPSASPPAPANTWVAAEAHEGDELPDPAARRQGWRLFALSALGATLVLGVAALVAWPHLRALWQPAPKDPTQIAATNYLQALVANDTEALRALGTVDEPPAIRSFSPPERGGEGGGTRSLRGSFKPLARFHTDIDKRFTFDPESGRFTVRNALGPAADTLDALHGAKVKAEQSKLFEKMASGDPEDLFDAAEQYAGVFANLAEGVLAPKKLVPTYGQLAADAKPPLPPGAKELAQAYADAPDTWNALLKRPFPTLKADGPFILDRATLTSQVRDRLASSGEPPSRLRLTLTRFRLEGIDTGWKVTAAERIDAEPGGDVQSTSPARPAGSTRRSPGEGSP